MTDAELLSYEPLIYRIARSYHKKTGQKYPLEDLISEGWVGLLKASKKHDPEQGDFEKYAPKMIAWGIMDFFRAEFPGSKEEYESGLRREGVEFIELPADQVDPTQRIFARQMYEVFFRSRTLTERERRILRWLYVDGANQATLAQREGVTEMSISIAHDRMLQKLRRVANGKL